MSEGIRGYDPYTAQYRELRCRDTGDGLSGVLLVSDDLGQASSYVAVPAGSTNGTALVTGLPKNVSRVMIILQPGDSVTGGYAPSSPAPSSPPITTKFANPSGSGQERVINLAIPTGRMFYVTAITGAPVVNY